MGPELEHFCVSAGTPVRWTLAASASCTTPGNDSRARLLPTGSHEGAWATAQATLVALLSPLGDAGVQWKIYGRTRGLDYARSDDSRAVPWTVWLLRVFFLQVHVMVRGDRAQALLCCCDTTVQVAMVALDRTVRLLLDFLRFRAGVSERTTARCCDTTVANNSMSSYMVSKSQGSYSRQGGEGDCQRQNHCFTFLYGVVDKVFSLRMCGASFSARRCTSAHPWTGRRWEWDSQPTPRQRGSCKASSTAGPVEGAWALSSGNLVSQGRKNSSSSETPGSGLDFTFPSVVLAVIRAGRDWRSLTPEVTGRIHSCCSLHEVRPWTDTVLSLV